MAKIKASDYTSSIITSSTALRPTWSESTTSGDIGAHTFAIQDIATKAVLNLTAKTGALSDTIYIEGSSSEYSIKVSGKNVYLYRLDDENKITQTIQINMGSVSKTLVQSVNLEFFDGELTLANSSGSTKIKLGDQSLTQYKKAISATLADSDVADNYFNVGETFTLTTAVDGPAGFVGTMQNDTYNAQLNGTDQNTLNNLDSIDGGGGNDTLNVELDSVTRTPTALTSIETINVVALGEGATLDLSNSTGLETLVNNGSNAGLLIANLQSVDTNIVISNTDFDSTYIDLEDASVTGGSDVLNITLDDVFSNLEIDSDVETMALTSSGRSNIIFTDFEGAITVTGDQDLSIFGEDGAMSAASVTSTGSGDLTVYNVDFAAHTLSGGSGNDYLDATGASSASLSGNNGDDELYGSNGNDTINGGSGSDYIEMNGGTDTVDAGSGDDTVWDEGDISASDVIAGGSGTDTLHLDGDVMSTLTTVGISITGFEVIELFDGYDYNITVDDAFVSSADSDTVLLTGVSGGDDVIVSAGLSVGNTFVLADGANAYYLADGVNNRVTIGASIDTGDAGTLLTDEFTSEVFLGTGNDTVTGSVSIDEVTLGSGSATLSLNTGADIINTTDANFDLNNTIGGGDGTDSIVFIDDSDADTVIDADFTNITSVENLVLDDNQNSTVTLNDKAKNAGIVNITSGTGADSFTLGALFTNTVTIAAGNGSNTFNLADFTGTATITGGSDVDTVTLGANIVNLSLAAGDDVINISNGALTASDTIAAGADNDTFVTTNAVTLLDVAFTNVSGVDVLSAAANDFALTATLGTLASSAGIRTVNGGDANDTINMSAYTAAVTINGAAGDNTITAGAGDDTISSGAGADTITAGAGADTISSGAGADTITAGAGIDTINAGDGVDSIALGADGSVDTITISSSSSGLDTISGFEAGAGGDVLDLSALEGLVDIVQTGAYATITSNFTDANVFIFDSTAINITAAANAIAATAAVGAVDGFGTGSSTDTFGVNAGLYGGFIVIKDSANDNKVTVYYSDNLGANGTETAVAVLTGVNILDLTAANFIV